MPPPHFSGPSRLAALNVSRGTLALVKEAAAGVCVYVERGGDAQRDAACTHIDALFADPALEMPAETEWAASAEADAGAVPCAIRAAVGEKLNVDLAEGFERVHENPDAVPRTLYILEKLAPLLSADVLVRDWWESVLYTALRTPALSDDDAGRARRMVVWILLRGPPTCYEPGAEPTENRVVAFAKHIFALYMDVARTQPDLAPLPEDVDEGEAVPSDAATDAWRASLEAILASYASYAPIPFLYHLQWALGDVYTEGPVLYLLASFLQAQSMHTSRITSTSLVSAVLAALLATRFSRSLVQGVRCLVMMLPHIPQCIARHHLAEVFAVYARACTWPTGAVDGTGLLFTLLYGLFPHNLLAFLHDPVHFGEHAAPALPLDGAQLRAHTLPLLRTHRANPLLAELDASAELQGSLRWAEAEAADLTASCMSLCIATDTTEAPVETELTVATAPSRSAHRFEIYLKNQLLLYIGRLHRDRIAHAADEAERQNLYHTVRTLRAQLLAAQARAERQRAESQATSQRHVQWEKELTTKLHTYRDERRASAATLQATRKQLHDAHTTVTSQAAQINEMGTRLFEQEHDLAFARPRLARIEEYGENVQKLSNCLSDWEEDLEKYELQGREMDKMLSWWEEMELTIANSEAYANRYRAMLDERTTENTALKTELRSARADAARAVQRLSAKQQAQLHAVLAPGSDHVQRAAAERELDAVRARNRELELDALSLRARVEQLESEARMRVVVAEDTGTTPSLLSESEHAHG